MEGETEMGGGRVVCEGESEEGAEYQYRYVRLMD